MEKCTRHTIGMHQTKKVGNNDKITRTTKTDKDTAQI